MTSKEKASISAAAIGWALTICIPLMAWQWNLQKRVTTVEVKQEVTETEVKYHHEENVKMFLRVDDKLDRIIDKVSDTNVKLEKKKDREENESIERH